MSERIIFHVDVNNAFLSWTALYLLKQGYQVDIRNIPSIIGGDESKRHGIVLAKSPVAKKYGIKTAETIYSARRKCPNLQIFPPNHKWYYEQSRIFHEYLRQYTPNTQKYSVDEAYLDFSGMHYIYDDYIKLAYKIKDGIKEKFGFTVNVGVANNMLCAKMASDFEKPDKVHTLFVDEVKSKLWPLPIDELFMVGKKTAERLKKIGIHTIGELANTDISLLKKHFKNQAQFLKDSANGIDYSKVERPISKTESISTTETLVRDVSEKSELTQILFRQTDDVARQLRERGKYCNVVAIIYKNSNFESYSKQIKLERATNNTAEIYKVVLHLLESSFRNEAIRLIGVRLADLSKSNARQVSLFDQEEEINESDDAVQKVVDFLNHRFGNNSVIPASMKRNRDE